jgi:hypothetical protein
MAQRPSIKRAADHDHAHFAQVESYDARIDKLLEALLDQTFPACDPVAVTPRAEVIGSIQTRYRLEGQKLPLRA